MIFKNSFLSRLFGAGPEEEAESVEEELLPVQEERPEEVQEEKQFRHELKLSPSHSLHKLWTIYSEETGWQPKPQLYLEGELDPVLPDSEAAKELLRLQMTVNATASKRLETLRSQQKTEEDGQISLPDLDAQAVVCFSSDSTAAWLLVYPPVGAGRELDWELIDQALGQNKVTVGVDRALLDTLPQDPERYFKLFPAARGTPPIPGEDGRVVDLFPRTEERKLNIDENNRVDYSNLNFIHNVEEGGVICRIIPPTQGSPGRTVQDQVLPARAGSPVSAPKGRNTELSEDGLALVATITGHVEFSGRSFQVRPVLDIPGNVDFSVGNINFLGDVCIHGDICSGFTVRAMGNITVGGVVEACTVEAGRDLIVARGVQGDNQAVVRAQRNIFAKYLENSCIYAKMNLETECIINCDVYCDGAVTVRSGHESIIGGTTRAAHEISAGVVGSRVGNRTDIFLGGQPCQEFDFDMLTKEIRELEDGIARTEQQPDSPGKLSRIGKLRVQLAVSRGKLSMLQKDREQQLQEPQDPGLRRMTCRSVFPGTVLDISGVVYHFNEKLSPCSATLADGEIRLI